MGAAEQRKKDSNMASYMKKHSIDRKAMNCPRCHSGIGMGSKSLLGHLNGCQGRRKVVHRK